MYRVKNVVLRKKGEGQESQKKIQRFYLALRSKTWLTVGEVGVVVTRKMAKDVVHVTSARSIPRVR